MKRYFLLIITGIVAISALWADSYHDTFVRYAQNDDLSDANAYVRMYDKPAQGYFPDQPLKADSVVREYMETQMRADVIEILEPYYRKHVTEAELQEMIAANSDSVLIQLQNKSKEIMRGWNQSSEYMAFINQIGIAINAISAKEQPTNLPVPQDISPEYIETFNRFYDSSGIDDLLSKACSSITQLLSYQLYQKGVQNVDEKVNGLMEYLLQNTRIVLLTLYSNSFTIDDLQLMTQNAQSDAYRHCNDAVKEVFTNPFEFGVTLMRKFQTWLEATYPRQEKQ